MTVFRLGEPVVFPDPELADEDGLLAVGGDLSPARLLFAYANGIFPWTAEGEYIPWFAPPWRMVLVPEQVHVSRSLAKVMRRGELEVRYDSDFEAVITACSRVPRPGQEGTWITADMVRAYTDLWRLGYAHSAETWRDGRLVGGLYGVTVGAVFCGESMFAHEPDASKVAFVALMHALADLGYRLVDCQVYTDHLASLGAEEWPRRTYMRVLRDAVEERPTRVWPTRPSKSSEPG